MGIRSQPCFRLLLTSERILRLIADSFVELRIPYRLGKGNVKNIDRGNLREVNSVWERNSK